jgi:hypothetical protein
MNRVRVNSLEQYVDEGAPAFLKRRRAWGAAAIRLANRFLALADSGTCMFASAGEWAAWEIHCARLLYPERPGVKAGPGRTVIIPRVGGVSLRELLQRGETDPGKTGEAFILAARELRRAHRIQCPYYNAGWSHGDLHLDNIICDGNAERAVLIDFDTRHEFRVGETQRQSDDVKVVLLELIGLPDERWRQPAAAFIAAYGAGAVLKTLSGQLSVPRGFARILWHARTNCAPLQRIEPRLRSLREIIAQVSSMAGTTSRANPGRDGS